LHQEVTGAKGRAILLLGEVLTELRNGSVLPSLTLIALLDLARNPGRTIQVEACSVMSRYNAGCPTAV